MKEMECNTLYTFMQSRIENFIYRFDNQEKKFYRSVLNTAMLNQNSWSKQFLGGLHKFIYVFIDNFIVITNTSVHIFKFKLSNGTY